MLDAMLENQLAAVLAVRPALSAIEDAATAACLRLRAGGRLIYAGAGTSGRIAVQDGAELPPTFGFPRDRLLLLMAGGDGALIRAAEGAEDELSGQDTAGLGASDVLVGVAASGTTPYTIGCVRAARMAGALTIGIANSPGAPLLTAAELAILLPTGPEPIAGSTRLGAGTAQKVALNLFSTLVMTRLGRVYRGQMVDMLATNAKLRRRAVRMLCGLAGTEAEIAAAALEQAGGRLKVALLVLRGMTISAAEQALTSAEGDLRRIPLK
jgi:N-acetylmuramic acid 6-phosphate etherase